MRIRDRLRRRWATVTLLVLAASGVMAGPAVAAPSAVRVTPGPTFAGYYPLESIPIAPQTIADDQVLTYTVQPYRYNGRVWTSISVSANGYVVPGGSGTTSDGGVTPALGEAAPNPVIAPFWGDLTLAGGGTVRVATVANTAEAPGVRSYWFVVQWRAREVGSSTTRGFQVWIRATDPEDPARPAPPAEQVYLTYDLPTFAAPASRPFVIGAENLEGRLNGRVTALPTDDLVVASGPTATDDEYDFRAGTTRTVGRVSGVLANDVGATGAQLASGPAGGTLQLDPDGGFRYTPASGSTGDDSFTYRAVDDQGLTRTATVTLRRQRATLTVAGAGAGSGAVSAPGIIACRRSSGATDGTCAASVPLGQTVTLTATPDAGSDFAGFTGACGSRSTTCTTTVEAAATVTATFTPRRTFTVTTTGPGRVTSRPAGIDCGSTCTATFSDAAQVTLVAEPDANATFTGFTGDCVSSSRTCTTTADKARAVTATFATEQRTLSVSHAGPGSGTVTSSPAGIDCGPDCSVTVGHGTAVTLTAAADAGSSFTGFTGAGCSRTGTTCTTTVERATTVTATFDRVPRDLAVAVTGPGRVTSAPAGIDCGTACTSTVPDGTRVTLIAEPAADATFTGFTGDCAGTGRTCVVTMDQARAVTATFAPEQRTLTVTRSGSGTGSVTAESAGIVCGDRCTATLPHGTTVTLTAAPDAGSDLAGFSGGGCSGTATTCTVTLDRARDVTAVFVARGGVLGAAEGQPAPGTADGPLAPGASTFVTVDPRADAGKRLPRRGLAELRVWCAADCRVAAAGVVRAGKRRLGGLRPRTLTRRMQAGRPTTLVLRASRATRRRIAAAAARGTVPVRARIVLDVISGDGTQRRVVVYVAVPLRG